MLVFFKERLVLLSVPKTGTTALETALAPKADMVLSGPPALKHAPVFRYSRFLRPMYEKVCGAELELMALMREPVDWLGSWYRYRRRPQMRGQLNSTHDISFDAFVEAYCQKERPSFADVGDQAKFLRPHPSGCAVKFLFAYEARTEWQDFLALRLGGLPDIPVLNASPAMELQLSPEVKARLERKHQDVFELYERVASGTCH